jgi:hypothetical protein
MFSNNYRDLKSLYSDNGFFRRFESIKTLNSGKGTTVTGIIGSKIRRAIVFTYFNICPGNFLSQVKNEYKT